MPTPTTALGELGHISQGITLSRHASEQGATYRIITVKDLDSLYIREVQEQAQLAPSVEPRRLSEGDVVIAIRGTLLKSSVVTANLEGSLSNQNTVFFRPNSKSIDPLYLAALLRSSYFDQLIASELQRSTTTLPAVRIADVHTLKIPLPNLETQTRIAELFLDLEEFKRVTASEIESRQKISEFTLLQALGQ